MDQSVIHNPSIEDTLAKQAQQILTIKRSGDPRFYALLDEIADLHSRKSHDYAPQDDPLLNFKATSALGVRPVVGVLVRMTDKWNRIAQLVKGKTPKNESLRDSLVDLAVYSLLTVILLAEEAKP
jgi:hypothetical protein